MFVIISCSKQLLLSFNVLIHTEATDDENALPSGCSVTQEPLKLMTASGNHNGMIWVYKRGPQGFRFCRRKLIKASKIVKSMFY